MKNPNYYLDIERFDSIVNVFIKELKKAQLISEKENNKITYKIQLPEDKKPSSILICYLKAGKVSFQSAGKNPKRASDLKDLLISQTEIVIGENKSFTVKPANEDEINTIIEFLKEECECSIEEIPSDSDTISKLIKVTGKYGETLSITYYRTKTLLVQGCPSLVFLHFIAIATELFNPAEIKKEHLKFFDASEALQVIDKDLSAHLPNAYPHIGEKLDSIMAPSLILLNHPKELTDYSAYAFPLLRGSEGVLKAVLDEYGIEIRSDFGEYFRFSKSQNKCIWNKDCSNFISNSELRKYLLHLYRIFHRERHTLFHIDYTVETTRILNFDQAMDIVLEGLKTIDNIYLHNK
jgi:hypothetical protein